MLSVLLHLGYGFVRASLSYPFRVGRGEAAFRRSYESEGLRPVSAEHRRLASSLERCIGCGRCDIAFPFDPAVHDLARSAWRTPLGAAEIRRLVGRLEPEGLRAAEALCPTAVPLEALARIVEAWAADASSSDGDGSTTPATGASTLV